jgi:Protein of unknown function (DUF433)
MPYGAPGGRVLEIARVTRSLARDGVGPSGAVIRRGRRIDAVVFRVRSDVVFRGTRIPVDVLFDNLADGMSLDQILEAYPGLNRRDAVAVIEMASETLKTPVP